MRHTPSWIPPRTEIGRREALAGLTALGAAAFSARAMAQPATRGACVLAPEAGEGPFYFDPELLRSDITEGKPGAPLELAMRVVRVSDCATLANARVDVWHSDALGWYSGYANQRGTGEPVEQVVGQKFLRGTQITDTDGRVRFRTIYPSWYQGRTPHVHFKVFLADDEVVASQVFFPEEVNTHVFENFAPYRERVRRRDTFNANDFLRDAGVYCAVQERPDGLYAELTIAVREA